MPGATVRPGLQDVLRVGSVERSLSEAEPRIANPEPRTPNPPESSSSIVRRARVMDAYGMVFENRKDAGRRLGAALAQYRGPDTIVLALPRGGVEVGLEVASKLSAPLDVFVARKIGAPGHPELGIGAVA